MAVNVLARPKRAQRDLTQDSLGKLLAALALPSTAEMALFSVMNIVHAYWMGRVGGLALASVAMGTTLRMVLISPMMGLSAGGMALVARHIGAGERREADRAVMQAILLLLLLTLIISTTAQIFLPTLLGWMGARGAVHEGAVAYLRIIFGGLLFMEMLPSMNGVIRGAGYPEYTLKINLVYVLVMMALEPVLVLGYGPFEPLGVRGAAWASVLGSASGVLAQLVTLVRGGAGVRLHLADLRPDVRMWWRILRIALPNGAQRFSPNLANAFLMRLVTSLGEPTLVAYSLVSRVFGVVQSVTMGVGNATAPLVGQNLGAGKPERSEAATRLGTLVAVSAALVLGLLLNAFPGPIFRFFGLEDVAMPVAITATRFMLLSAIFAAWMEVVSRALAGAGETLLPMLVSIAALWLIQLPMAALLSHVAGLGPIGLWLGLVLSYLFGGLAMAWRFRTGHWKTIRI